jgi:hypothetical protein
MRDHVGMKATDIRVGDTLTLKADNPYGLGPATRTVAEVREKAGYKSVWIITDQLNDLGAPEAFKASDFSGRV